MTTQAFEEHVRKSMEHSKSIQHFLENKEERPATTEEILAFEVLNNLHLPESFKFFATKYGCGDFVFSTVLYVLTDSEFYIENFRDYLDKTFIPIIDNDCGDYYCFLADGIECSDTLYFVDHELSYGAPYKKIGPFFEFMVETALMHDS